MSVKKRIAILATVLVIAAAALGMTAWVPILGFSVRNWFAPGFIYAGTIEATKVDVPARVSTVIASEAVQEGDSVKADQVLAQLEGQDVKLNEELLSSYYARANLLVREGQLPLSSYESLKNSLELAKLQSDWLTVKSPVTGTVLTRYHEPGEALVAGSRLFTVADLDRVWAYIYVPETVLARVRVGTRVAGRLPELPQKEFPGTVLKINEEAEFTPKNVQTERERTRLVFGIKIGFENPDRILKPGLPIEVTLPEPSP
ncbi:MAG TPA: efflux RND transporter periplasmic adaptor subunit [bacterium]|nr:efflux RND transporter periplasmic adaptor subunit [bacterium]